ncbi:YciI family protein [Pararhodobacter sp.]|uniref:YciI family protein n=1 Tax=Pararhodobacter sp. TaxID=2127056 RepID=UPI002FDE2FA6
MRVMVLIRAREAGETAALPGPAQREAMARFNEALMQAGILRAGEGLQPSVKARRIVRNGAESAVLEGSFHPSEALIAGFWLWEVRDMDEAVAWAMRCPDPVPGRYEIEIRPVTDGMNPFAEPGTGHAGSSDRLRALLAGI